MRRFMHAWVTAMLLILVLVSCTLANQQTGNEPAATDGDLIGADADRVTAPEVTAEQPTALVSANNHFATDLYQIVAGESDGNLLPDEGRFAEVQENVSSVRPYCRTGVNLPAEYPV
ncbi:MAG: hypothetical protein ACOC9V_05215, partial [Chloroflexota bacterium]